MSFNSKLMTVLVSHPGSYKELRKALFGYKTHNEDVIQLQRIRKCMSRMKKKGYVKKEGSVWLLTGAGRNYLTSYKPAFEYFNSPFKETDLKKMLVVFDIPEREKRKRAWLRRQLKIFNYEMVQRSVWLGPYPLPSEFNTYLRKLAIKNYIQWFKILKKN